MGLPVDPLRAANASRMNETDFIREQLRLERTHLREILRAWRQTGAGEPPQHPVALYLDWAGRRLIDQVLAHHTALRDAGTLDPALGPALAAATSAARQAQNGTASAAHLRAEALLALLEAWSEPLDVAAGRALRIPHWRRAAQLSADSIIQERQLYAAARGAVAAR